MQAIENFQLSENSIRSFLREAPQSRSVVSSGVLAGTIAVLFCLVGFFLLNINSFTRLSQTSVTIPPRATPTTPDPSSQPVATSAPTPIPVAIPDLPDNTLYIAALEVSAPVLWDTPLDSKVLQERLEQGIVHIAQTAKPGQHGTVIITGHSSNYFWDRGDYNNVFAPLQKAVAGQEIAVSYLGTTYVYRVELIYEVTPDKIEVLNASQTDVLRVITCTPLGTSLRRLIVEAVQISPDPASNTVFQQAQFTGTVPVVR